MKWPDLILIQPHMRLSEGKKAQQARTTTIGQKKSPPLIFCFLHDSFFILETVMIVVQTII